PGIIVIFRFLQATFAICLAGGNLAAQSAPPRSPAQGSSGTPPQAAAQLPGVPAGSPSATPTAEALVNSLGPADLQAARTRLKHELRASEATGDLAQAAEFAKRFCPRGKTIFNLRKPAGRQDRVFNSDRDPAFRGVIMVLADGDTAGTAEAIAAALRFHNKALVIGQPTAGRAADYSDFPLPNGKILRVAVAEMIAPDGASLIS